MQILGPEKDADFVMQMSRSIGLVSTENLLEASGRSKYDYGISNWEVGKYIAIWTFLRPRDMKISQS